MPQQQTRGCHADIHGREGVGHHNPICPFTCRQLLQALLYAGATPHIAIAAGPLHVLHVIINLIDGSNGSGGGRQQRLHVGGGGGLRQTAAASHTCMPFTGS
jgi:hypothetical protein